MSESAMKVAEYVKKMDVGEKLGEQSLTPTHVRFTKGYTKGKWLPLDNPSSIDKYFESHSHLNKCIEIKTQEGIIIGCYAEPPYEWRYIVVEKGQRKKNLKIWNG